MPELTIPYLTLRRPWAGFSGYFSDPANAGYTNVSSPSQNCMITSDRKVEKRRGYQAEFSIGVTNKNATPFYHKTYDIAFFALDTKVFYRDFTQNATYDTGITLTTGTTTRFSEFLGDVYLTNTTDGPQRIVCMRLNGTATAGALNIVTDIDGAARISVFGLGTSGNLRINGVNEAYNNTGTVTGAVTDGGLIKITTSVPTGIQTGDSVTIASVTGTTEANGTWTVTRIDSTHFDLQTSTFTNAYVSGGTWTLNSLSTGNFNMTALTQGYADNTVAIRVHDIHTVTGIEKPSKILFWKSRLHLMGFPSATNADQPNNSVIAGQFVIGQTGASGIEKIIDFTYGTGGSTKIVVGGMGKVTNILGVKDYLYFFTEDAVYSTLDSDISTDAASASIGLTIPHIKDELHGCINEDCATVMGDSALTYVTTDKRIMQLTISTDTGAAVSSPQEDFDVPIRGHLLNMSKDQTGAFAYHFRGGRQTIYQLNIAGQWTWFIFDHNVVVTNGLVTQVGVWQPPQFINPATNLFERDGVLYGTDVNTDTVYSYFNTFSDNGTPIQCTIATGEFNCGNAMIRNAQLSGDISFPAQINIRCFVVNNTNGKRCGSTKYINGKDYTYSDSLTVGSVNIGAGSSGSGVQIAPWKRAMGVFPSEATKVQLVLDEFQDGGYMSLYSYLISGDSLAGTFKPQL